MMKTKKQILVLLVNLGFLFSSCASGAVLASQTASTKSIIPANNPASNSVPLPIITLTKGDFYFKVNGKPSFLFSRNMAGFVPNDFAVLLGKAYQAGDVFVRVDTGHDGMGMYKGFGYIDVSSGISWPDELHECISSYPDNRDVQQIIKSYLKKNRVEKIIKF